MSNFSNALFFKVLFIWPKNPFLYVMNMEKQTLKLKAFLVAMVTQDPINKKTSNQPDCRFLIIPVKKVMVNKDLYKVILLFLLFRNDIVFHTEMTVFFKKC